MSPHCMSMLAPMRDVSLVMESPQQMSDSADCVLSGLVLADEEVGSASCQFVNGAVKGLIISSSQEQNPGHICCGGARHLGFAC